MNTPVSFEIAKLLKEKGFNEEVKPFYNGLKNNELIISDIIGTSNNLPDWYPAPTIAEVVMWLYEKHNIWIYVDSHEFGKWCYNYKFNRPHKLSSKITENGQFGLDDYNTPTEAYENAIKFVLENLI